MSTTAGLPEEAWCQYYATIKYCTGIFLLLNKKTCVCWSSTQDNRYDTWGTVRTVSLQFTFFKFWKGCNTRVFQPQVFSPNSSNPYYCGKRLLPVYRCLLTTKKNYGLLVSIQKKVTVSGTLLMLLTINRNVALLNCSNDPKFAVTVLFWASRIRIH
jgi:hypothetical protein